MGSRENACPEATPSPAAPGQYDLCPWRLFGPFLIPRPHGTGLSPRASRLVSCPFPGRLPEVMRPRRPARRSPAAKPSHPDSPGVWRRAPPGRARGPQAERAARRWVRTGCQRPPSSLEPWLGLSTDAQKEAGEQPGARAQFWEARRPWEQRACESPTRPAGTWGLSDPPPWRCTHWEDSGLRVGGEGQRPGRPVTLLRLTAVRRFAWFLP